MKSDGFVKGFKKGALDFSHTISIIVNSVLLSVVYLLGVGFTSLFAKFKKKHFMDMKVSKANGTYWSDLNHHKKQLQDYYRQF